MSAKYWRDRWIEALVHNGMDRRTAEEAYARTYADEPADQSKSPEIQALMTLPTLGGRPGARDAGRAAKH